MASQEEWRQISHEREQGRRTGNSGGTMHGAQGAAEFHRAQKEQADRDKRLRDLYRTPSNPPLLQPQPAVKKSPFPGNLKMARASQSGAPNQSTSELKQPFSWRKPNTVFALIGFTVGLYLCFSRFSMATGEAIACAAFAGLIVGRFYEAVVVMLLLYLAVKGLQHLH